MRWATNSILASSFAIVSCAIPQRTTTVSLNRWAEKYEESIRTAAVRNPDWSIPLRPLGNGSVLTVGTFTEYRDLDTAHYYVWVSSPVPLWELCKGKPDPVLAIQQILGLPPQANPQPGNEWHIFVFEVDRAALFRPCPGGTDPDAPPDAPRCLAGNALDAHLDEETARFLLNQFWIAHHVSFESGGKTYFGYPWTGTGWSYNWDPESRTHVGVSEFVVRKGATAYNVRSITPAKFCGAPGPPTGVAVSAQSVPVANAVDALPALRSE